MSNNKRYIDQPDTSSLENLEKRNQAAQEALDAYYANAVRSCEVPCNRCECVNTWGECEECEWYDFNGLGIWALVDDERLEKLYNAEKPEGCKANPFRYSSVIGEWIVPGALVPWVSSPNLVDMMDEYEMLAGMIYGYRFVNRDIHEHAHSFSGVVVDLLRDPENFYIPCWAQNDYSEQEILFLEVVRERLCYDMGILPKVDILWSDEEDEKKLADIEKDGGSVFQMRVRSHIAEMRAETQAKQADRRKYR